MNLITLSWKNLKSKPLNTALSLVLFAIGVALISMMLLLSRQLNDKFMRNIDGINMVVGAKGSPLQTILSSVYHIDVPTGNIPYDQALKLASVRNFVEKAIPQALGDNYEGYHIVGTNYDYTRHYKAEIAEGKLWEKHMEVTLGASVARKAKLKIGDTFSGAHGLVNDGMHIHDTYKYVVVGIFKPNNTVVDQLIFTNIESVWLMHAEHDEENIEFEADAETHEGHDHAAGEAHDHEGHDHEGHDHAEADTSASAAHDHADHEDHDHAAHGQAEIPEFVSPEGKELTSLMIIYKKDSTGTVSTMAEFALTDFIDNHLKDLSYALPLREINRLMGITGIGQSALKWLAFIYVLISAFSIFITLYSSLKARKYELSLMRVMGASRAKLFMLIVLEGVLISALGVLLGIALSHGGMGILAYYLEDAYQYPFQGFFYFLKEEVYLIVGALVIGFLAALLPAWQAYRTDISRTLAEA